MPTIVTHALVPATLAVLAGRTRISPRLALAGVALAMLPDADVAGFRFGIAYADQWGHRGASHSLALAAAATLLLAALWREARGALAAAFLFASMASHGLLDTLTDGGKGCALFWPFDTGRYFAMWRPIRVSPIGARFFSPRGLETALSEFVTVWLPCGLLMVLGWLVRRRGVLRRG